MPGMPELILTTKCWEKIGLEMCFGCLRSVSRGILRSSAWTAGRDSARYTVVTRAAWCWTTFQQNRSMTTSSAALQQQRTALEAGWTASLMQGLWS
eukprot:2130658-Amphidinium_carterae.1